MTQREFTHQFVLLREFSPHNVELIDLYNDTVGLRYRDSFSYSKLITPVAVPRRHLEK